MLSGGALGFFCNLFVFPLKILGEPPTLPCNRKSGIKYPQTFFALSFTVKPGGE